MYYSSVNISILVLFIAICCKGNTLYNPDDKLTRCCYYAASNNKRTPTPKETTIIMFFKLCIFIIALFQSPMEAVEEPRGNAATLTGGRLKAANNWRELSFPRLISHQLFVFVYQQEIYPGKTRWPATWRAAGCQAHLTKSRRCLRCKEIAMLSIRFSRGKLRHSRAPRRQHIICVFVSVSFFFGVHVMSICDTKINWKSVGGWYIARRGAAGLFILRKSFRCGSLSWWPATADRVGSSCLAGRRLNTTAYSIVPDLSPPKQVRRWRRPTHASSRPWTPTVDVPDVNHIQVIWTWREGGDEKKKWGESVAGRW